MLAHASTRPESTRVDRHNISCFSTSLSPAHPHPILAKIFIHQDITYTLPPDTLQIDTNSARMAMQRGVSHRAHDLVQKRLLIPRCLPVFHLQLSARRRSSNVSAVTIVDGHLSEAQPADPKSPCSLAPAVLSGDTIIVRPEQPPVKGQAAKERYAVIPRTGKRQYR